MHQRHDEIASRVTQAFPNPKNNGLL